MTQLPIICQRLVQRRRKDISTPKPLANRCFATIESLDQAVGNRCVALAQQQDTIRNSTLFHWWPRQRARK